MHTYSSWSRPAHLVEVLEQIPPAELRAFRDLACTIGGYIVFPVQTRVDGRWRRSINQSRGMHPRSGTGST
ncbi:MAG: hypothetical protein MUF35_07985 [Candidatus Nanopelagicales bacterium]|nr:hypothetical protein [Candidatus Nanopelagicales bacterium]